MTILDRLMMKTYTQLQTHERGAPCLEYPGEWLLYLPIPYKGSHTHTYPTLEEAKRAAMRITNVFEEAGLEYDIRKVSIGWKCSDNDPRIGQVWFTGFFVHGRYNLFGDYKET